MQSLLLAAQVLLNWIYGCKFGLIHTLSLCSRHIKMKKWELVIFIMFFCLPELVSGDFIFLKNEFPWFGGVRRVFLPAPNS